MQGFFYEKKIITDLFDKSDMSEALEWIKESLLDVLDDRDEESSEGIPLVPLTDYSSAAMDSPSFQKLIRAMGFTPPADEQESYWRIPSNMLSSTIQKRCNLIDAALAGNFSVEGNPFFFFYFLYTYINENIFDL